MFSMTLLATMMLWNSVSTSRGAAHPPQHLLGLLRVAALHQGVGRVGEEDAACTALHRLQGKASQADVIAYGTQGSCPQFCLPPCHMLCA